MGNINLFETLEGEKLNFQFQSGMTYAVRGVLSFSQNTTIPENVTLIFQGGIIKSATGSEITITGNNTRLEAPICTIFGKNIDVEGTWDIDRAYPQWFDKGERLKYIAYNNYTGDTYTEDFYDWSTPINKAIKMKQVGEVFLKNGDYSIASPIVMNCRIHLVGESCQWKELVKNQNEPITGCTRIFPVAGGNNTYTDEYLLYVNAEPDTKTTIPNNESIVRSTLVKNICFTNWIKKSSTEKVSQKCVLAGGGVHFDRVVWYDFLQAVKYTHTYNDGRSITNCVFETEPQGYEKNDAKNNIYAFDTEFLGDGMKFELNGIANTANGKALRISNCGGAAIQSNVINGDILIHQSKAIVFNANHCENGIQIEIVDSCVSTQNNYIWKGEKPTYFIHSSGSGDKSVVSLNNDLLIVRNYLLKDPTIANSVDLLSTLKTDMEQLANYDIKMDKETILNINNIFRYDIGFYGFGKMYPCGIKIEKEIDVYNEEENKYEKGTIDFKEFNNYSYCASCKSQILSGFNLNVQKTIKGINTPDVFVAMQNQGVYWLGEKGYYQYHYQILWDETRDIKKIENTTNVSKSIFTTNWHGNIVPQLEPISNENNETLPQGVLFGLNENINGNCTMVRLFREHFHHKNLTERSKLEYVDVPVCGTQYLYDNGVSVSGYQWKSEGASSLFLQNTSDKKIEMFRIIDGNVECFTKSGFTPGNGWKRGDIIHNISSNPSTLIVSDDIN